MILKPLSSTDIGKHIIYGIYRDDINKSYGVIVSFDDECVVCRFGSKEVECSYDDLDWDIQPGEPFGTEMEEGWANLMERFNERTRKKLNKL